VAEIVPVADLAPHSFFAMLSPKDRALIADLGIERSFPPGSILMFEREPGERVMILLEGRVKVSMLSADGHQTVLSIRDPGEVLGELSCIDRDVRLATVTALDPVRALVIPAQALRRLLESRPRMTLVLLEEIATRFRDTTRMSVQLATSDTLGRLAARLMELAERYGEPVEEGVEFDSPLSQEDLAAWAGASRAGIAHALQELRRLGWIRTDRRIVLVRDMDALRARAG
jgi:CRP-like cAMP-binding protein